MFNFLVTAAEGAWNGEPYVFGPGRFLEFTNDELKERFRSLDATVLAPLREVPSLFAYEEMWDEPARVGWIRAIQVRGGEVRVTYALDPNIPPIRKERLKDVSWQLEVSGGEMSRTHWSVKAPDLLEVLHAHGMLPAGTGPANGTVFAFSRGTIINACDLFQRLSHADLDRLLLELGVPGLKAGRERGSLRTRANVIAEYVLAHPGESTADGEKLSVAVVRRAAGTDPDYPDSSMPGVPPTSRASFWTGLERDGYAFRDGVVIAIQGPVVPPYARSGRPASAVEAESVDLFADKPVVMAAVDAAPSAARVGAPRKDKVFLVHGRDHGAKETVARFLERLGIEVVILHERANQGRTLISKFREESADVGFAVVVMTPDDIGGLKPVEGHSSTELSPRARQNVVFELGFFIGKLGPERVCALVSGALEKPSDFEAVVYVEFGPTSAWKIELARELDAAGIQFDHLKIL